MTKKNTRPILEKITKVNIDNEDRDTLLEWSRRASAEENAAISTRHIIKRLIEWFKRNERKGYPTETRGNSGET